MSLVEEVSESKPRKKRDCVIGKATLLKVIQAYCLECCCGQAVEVRECRSIHCKLWEYRNGAQVKKTKLKVQKDLLAGG